MQRGARTDAGRRNLSPPFGVQRLRFNPKALALKRIRWQPYWPALTIAMKFRPIHVHAPSVEAGESFKHLLPILAALAERRQPADGGIRYEPFSHTHQSRLRTDLHKHVAAGVRRSARMPAKKLHRLANVPAPIGCLHNVIVGCQRRPVTFDTSLICGAA